MKFDQILQTLKNQGLNIFMSVKVSDIPADLYTFTDEQKNKTLCLLAHGGKELWKNLDPKAENPFDDFSIKAMHTLSNSLQNPSLEILFPHSEKIFPLQRLGRFLNLSERSPLGIDISAEYGLWFAFRGVFLINGPIALIKNSMPPDYCENCHERLCLNSPQVSGARLLCPIKIEHQYDPSQLEYHKTILKIS